jgi:transmembrane sensor
MGRPAPPAPATPTAAVDAAIAWMVKLQSGAATPQDHEACQRWQRERPEHAQAWATLDGLSRRLKALPPALAHATLAQRDSAAVHPPRRRTVLKGLLLVGGTGALALAAHDEGGWRGLVAQHHTGVGERMRVALADGSVLHLNTATAVDERFDAPWRCVRLHQGEVMVECVPDRQASPPRPFVVRTAEGEVRSAEGRFVVRQHVGHTGVQALEGLLAVHPRGRPGEAAPVAQLQPGQQLVFEAAAAGRAQPVDAGPAAWVDGLLVARDMRLATLAAELARYRRGWLRCAEAVACLRISGVFPVDDLGRVVAALERTLPVRARSYTPWWVTLGPR